MPWRLLSTLVLPFLGYCIAFAAATVAVDVALHAAGLGWVGRYLGIPGVLLILLSLTYSLRKRGKIHRGDPRTLLAFHQWAGWAGASLVLVHAGLHFEALLPWVATAAMCADRNFKRALHPSVFRRTGLMVSACLPSTSLACQTRPPKPACRAQWNLQWDLLTPTESALPTPDLTPGTHPPRSPTHPSPANTSIPRAHSSRVCTGGALAPSGSSA